ncbi:MAG: pilin [Bacillota bacterium]|nr:pilin [Bacillota bacterium]
MRKFINNITLGLMMLLPASVLAYSAPSVGIIDPGTKTDVPKIINDVIGWVLLLTGSITVLFIVYGGFKYVTSAGNKEQAESAKKTLTYAIIGLVIIVLAKIVVSLVTNSIKEIL